VFIFDCMHVTTVYGMLPLKTERNKLLGKSILKWMLKKGDLRFWTGFLWLWTETSYRLLSCAYGVLSKY